MEKAVAAKPLFRDKVRRVWELDFLRGVAVIAMCFDHLMFDCAHPSAFFSNYYEVYNSFMDKLYGFARSYWDSTATFGFRFWAHYIFVFLFLFLVGTSCAFSRDNTRRGALCTIAAFAFTGISYACKAFGFMDYGVVFGILHCIALSILCAAALDIVTKWNKHVNLYAPLIIGAVILFIGVYVKFWNFAPFDREFIGEHYFGYVLGSHSYGDDWFGLFPYVGVVLVGMYWGKSAYGTRVSLLPILDKKWHKPITFVGKHALIFYFLHQPAMVAIFILMGLCMGFKV